MTGILLDTDIVIQMLREGRYEPGGISTITLIEILRGIREEKQGEVKRLLEESFDLYPIDNRVIETYCKLYNTLKERGEPIPDADLLIAATALANDLTLKTRNHHFERLKELGLKISGRE